MLKQVLKQNPSKVQAESETDTERLISPLSVEDVETHHHVVRLGDAVAAPDEMMLRAIERFWQSFEVDASGCWNWTVTVNQKGYGRMWTGSRTMVAHRFAYELVNGPVPDGLDAAHLCHNRRCVNPDHIKAMTRSENLLMRPGVSDGRSRALTPAERSARYNAKRRERRRLEAIESGWWVRI